MHLSSVELIARLIHGKPEMQIIGNLYTLPNVSYRTFSVNNVFLQERFCEDKKIKPITLQIGKENIKYTFKRRILVTGKNYSLGFLLYNLYHVHASKRKWVYNLKSVSRRHFRPLSNM